MQCNACWAFATIGAVESRYKISTGKTVILSEQNLIDCSPGMAGCVSGWPTNAFTYIYNNSAHGVALNSSYPYTAAAGTCKSPSLIAPPVYATAPLGYKGVMAQSKTQMLYVSSAWCCLSGLWSLARNAQLCPDGRLETCLPVKALTQTEPTALLTTPLSCRTWLCSPWQSPSTSSPASRATAAASTTPAAAVALSTT